MYKSIDFEYDLWKTSDGKCFARVKSTGEVCEISSDTMKLLRCEEKRIYRELALKKSLESKNVDEKTKASIRYPLSFDVCDDESEELSAWIGSDENLENEQIAKDLENRVMNLLTDHQREVFICVMKNGEKLSEFASRNGTTYQNVQSTVSAIRKKVKKLFE